MPAFAYAKRFHCEQPLFDCVLMGVPIDSMMSMETILLFHMKFEVI